METNALSAISPVVLGTRLANARLVSGLTEQQVADATGVPRSEIAAIENGERQPRATELVKLTRHYGRPIQEFVRSTPQPFAPTGSEVSARESLMAVQACLAGDLTEVQLAKYLGTDIVSARDFVWRSGLDSSSHDENN